ncbi:MAG: antitoxin [Actinobacteria bacterium]|nr:antitoxin [Actinomycetota bacterium]
MRTTITLESDTEQLIRARMRDRGCSFKEAINGAIRDGHRTDNPTTFESPIVPMGRPSLNLDRALYLAAELDDEALADKLATGS